MSTPTNIPETPMGETKQDSLFESKEKFQKQLQHIFQTTLKLTTIFFGVLHPRNVHNLVGWVQEYEKKSNKKLRFPYSCTLSMYSKNENFFDTSPLIYLIHLGQQAK